MKKNNQGIPYLSIIRKSAFYAGSLLLLIQIAEIFLKIFIAQLAVSPGNYGGELKLNAYEIISNIAQLSFGIAAYCILYFLVERPSDRNVAVPDEDVRL